MRRLLLLAMLLGACGDPLVSGGYKPPYFTVVAQFSSPTALPPNTSIALLWESEQPDGGPHYVSQLVGTRDLQFPDVYNIDLDALPPAAASIPVGALDSDVDPHLVFATGTIVVYDDKNDNGTLDLDPRDGNDSPDTVLGAADDVSIFYLVAGRPAPARFFGLLPTTPGFSIVSVPAHHDPQPGDCDLLDAEGHDSGKCESQTDGLPVALSPSQTIDIELGATAELQRYACTTFWGPEKQPDWALLPPSEVCGDASCVSCYGYDCPLDVPPAGVAVTCGPIVGGVAYTYTTCADNASLCGTTFCHFGHGALATGAPAPAGWPCN